MVLALRHRLVWPVILRPSLTGRQTKVKALALLARTRVTGALGALTRSKSSRSSATRRAPPSLQPTRSKGSQVLRVTSDWLLFDEAERDPDDCWCEHLEAMSQLTTDEKTVLRAVHEGLLLRDAAGA